MSEYPRRVAVSPSVIKYRMNKRYSSTMIALFYVLCVGILFFMLYAGPSLSMLSKQSRKPYQLANASSISNSRTKYAIKRPSGIFNVSLSTDAAYSRKPSNIAKSSLYTNSEYIMELTGSEVRSLLANVSQHYPVIMVYYASWCGHCQHFVQVYEKIASEVIPKLKIPVILGALDCVNYNKDCYEAGIRLYPSAIAYNIDSGTVDFSCSIESSSSDRELGLLEQISSPRARLERVYLHLVE
jgi:thiol-disulfide isomerase/thioredoxin